MRFFFKRLGPVIVVSLISIIFAGMGPYRYQEKKSPQEILSIAAQNGARVMSALRSYSCDSELTFQTVNVGDVVTGAYRRLSKITYDKSGNRRERILEEKSSLPRDTYIGSNAVNNLIHVYQFILTPEAVSLYEITFIGAEKVDELDTYVFDLRPSLKLPDPESSRDRYLKGRIWIDQQDLQVVKAAGEAVPEQSAHRTPKFETYFQNKDRYWFPAYTSADDDIRSGHSVMRVIVKLRFTGYEARSGS